MCSTMYVGTNISLRKKLCRRWGCSQASPLSLFTHNVAKIQCICHENNITPGRWSRFKVLKASFQAGFCYSKCVLWKPGRSSPVSLTTLPTAPAFCLGAEGVGVTLTTVGLRQWGGCPGKAGDVRELRASVQVIRATAGGEPGNTGQSAPWASPGQGPQLSEFTALESPLQFRPTTCGCLRKLKYIVYYGIQH